MKHLPSNIEPIRWQSDELHLLDQRLLPHRQATFVCRSVAEVADAIESMVVRGAPAIGVAAAYGIAMSVKAQMSRRANDWLAAVEADAERLRSCRPTAINLNWAVDAMMAIVRSAGDPLFDAAVAAAVEIHRQDLQANLRIGDAGAAALAGNVSVLTHCNAGALATAGYGTALGVIRSAVRDGKIRQVFATETRPWMQGARLTAWELLQDGIDVTLIADGAAAHVMKIGEIDWVITGADRIAANGDVANKIGTYALACLAREHGVRFMVAAPISTIDLNTPTGDLIPIEQRSGNELTHVAEQPVAAAGADTFNPVFDVTPAHLIDVIVTERGLIEKPGQGAITALFEDKN